MDSLTAARIRALELAIDTIPNGAKIPDLLSRADDFAKFIINGKTPDAK